MAESEIPFAVVLFFLCEFFVGAIAGASIAKDRASGPRGMTIAMALALLVFIYATVVSTLATQPLPNNLLLIIPILLGAVIGTLILGFCYWLICLLFACAGYWSAFIVFRRLGIGPNRITLASIFAFITILAAVTAIMTVRP